MLCQRCRHATAVARQLRRSSTLRAATAPLAVVARSRISPAAPITKRWLGAYPTAYYSTNSGAAAPAASSAPADSSSTLPEKPDYLNDAESAIWDKLAAEFTPTELVVQDISGGCGSMYGIEIASEKFRGTNMLKQQRMVNAALGDEMKGWHGVQLRTRVPSS
ncbi:bola protein [Xylariales sp. PMI_506]|nr:bola protein [Xylariales sp. PMI_506]